MSVGGMTSVRGYEESAFMSDYGMTASAEVRFPVPFLRMMLPEKLHFVDDSIRLAGFYDLGWYGNVKSGDGSDMVMSVGGGVILKLTKYIIRKRLHRCSNRQQTGRCVWMQSPLHTIFKHPVVS